MDENFTYALVNRDCGCVEVCERFADELIFVGYDSKCNNHETNLTKILK